MFDNEFLEILRGLYSDQGDERFGYIGKDNEIVEFTNIHPDPRLGFEASEEDLVRMEQDEDAWAIWHTQPSKTSQLSYEDYVGFINFPEYRHVVIGVDGVRVYQVENGRVLKDGMYLNA